MGKIDAKNSVSSVSFPTVWHIDRRLNFPNYRRQGTSAFQNVGSAVRSQGVEQAQGCTFKKEGEVKKTSALEKTDLT